LYRRRKKKKKKKWNLPGSNRKTRKRMHLDGIEDTPP
jgi:hypothetical protein